MSLDRFCIWHLCTREFTMYFLATSGMAQKQRLLLGQFCRASAERVKTTHKYFCLCCIDIYLHSVYSSGPTEIYNAMGSPGSQLWLQESTLLITFLCLDKCSSTSNHKQGSSEMPAPQVAALLGCHRMWRPACQHCCSPASSSDFPHRRVCVCVFIWFCVHTLF